MGKVAVVPHAGTWIEIPGEGLHIPRHTSFPTRERGLKFFGEYHRFYQDGVVPHAGTWIESFKPVFIALICLVVPHAGTWIESGIYWLVLDQTLVVPHAGTTI